MGTTDQKHKLKSFAEMLSIIFAGHVNGLQSSYGITPELFDLVPRMETLPKTLEEQLAGLDKHIAAVSDKRDALVDVCQEAILDSRAIFRSFGFMDKDADENKKEARKKELEEEIAYLNEKLSDEKRPAFVQMFNAQKMTFEKELGALDHSKSSKFRATECGMKLVELKEEGKITTSTGKTLELGNKSHLKDILIDLYTAGAGVDLETINIPMLRKSMSQVLQIKELAMEGFEDFRQLIKNTPKLREQHIQEMTETMDKIPNMSEKQKLGEQLFIPSIFMSESAYRGLKQQVDRKGYLPQEHRTFYIYGPPGVGKSSILQDLSHWLNIGFLPFSVPQLDTTSFGFMTMDESIGKAVTELPDDMSPVVSRAGVVLFDEANRTDMPGIDSRMLRLLLNHEIGGGYKINLRSVVVAAGNAKSLNPGAIQSEDLAMANRITHLYLDDLDLIRRGWLNYASNNFRYTDQKSIAQAMIAFVADTGESGGGKKFLDVPNADDMEEYSGEKGLENYPTPRSITSVMNIASRYESSDMTFDQLRTFMESTVGKSFTNSFSLFLDSYLKIPNMDTLIQEVDGTEFNLLHAAMALDSEITISREGITVDSIPDKTFERVVRFDQDIADKYTDILMKQKDVEEKRAALNGAHNSELYNQSEELFMKQFDFKFGKNVSYMEDLYGMCKKVGLPIPPENEAIKVVKETGKAGCQKLLEDKINNLWIKNGFDKLDLDTNFGLRYAVRSILIGKFMNTIESAYHKGEPADGDLLKNYFKIITLFPSRGERTQILRTIIDKLQNPTETLKKGMAEYGFKYNIKEGKNKGKEQILKVDKNTMVHQACAPLDAMSRLTRVWRENFSYSYTRYQKKLVDEQFNSIELS